MIDIERYRLPGDYWLMLPSYDLEAAPNTLILYDVVEVLKLRYTAGNLAGHPSVDLAATEAWGQVSYPVRRVERKLAQGYMVGLRYKETYRDYTGKGQERIGFSIKFFGPDVYNRVLSDEDKHWLRMITETSDLYKAQVEAEQPPDPDPDPEPPKPKRKRQRVKERRRLQRRERIEADY